MQNKIVRLLFMIAFSNLHLHIFSQNVGINTISPEGLFHIKGTVNGSQCIIDANSIQSNSSPLLKFRKSSGADLMWIHSDDSLNVFLGLKAGRVNAASSLGINNSFIGSRAGSSNTSGNDNTAVGSSALLSNTTGSDNSACGTYSLSNLLAGNQNLASGFASGTAPGSPNVSNTISLGNHGYLNAASNQAFLGNLSTIWNGGNVTWSTYSDARVKNDVREDVIGLAFITRLRPVTYYRSIKAMTDITGNTEAKDYPEKYDIENIKFSGFLAQEVEQAAQQASYDFSGITVPKNSQELYTLSYAQFVVPLVKAVQELNTALTTEVADLKSAAGDMQSEINALKAMNGSLLHRLEKIESDLKQ